MDQLKDFLKQVVKYRFWIAVGISLLLPMIAYFVGSGPIKKKAADETAKITEADKGVAAYTGSDLPNAQYKPLVEAKTEVVTTDVNKAWEKLYARQAPLLTWPVSPSGTPAPMPQWGRKLPEDVDKGAIRSAITDYIQVYDKAVTETYKKVNPWMPMEGTGIVVVPDEKALLGPLTFDVANPPKLGKVWAAQERLWVQGAVLDAVARINGPALEWDGAVVRQIDMLDIGSPTAQDQVSLAAGESATKAPAVDPEEEVSAEAGGSDQSGYGAPADMGSMMGMGGKGGMSMPGAGYGGMGGGMGAVQHIEDIYYVGAENPQFKTVPIMMQALVDQNRLQDFFIGLENSPMAIQVIEFDLVKPTTPVAKPVKGEPLSGFGGGYGMMMMGGRGGMMMPGAGYGNEGGMMPGGGYGQMMGGRGGMMMPGGGMPGGGYGNEGMMMPGGGMGGVEKKGTDVRQKDAAKARAEKEKIRKAITRAMVDQYYDIVQVTVYGRARFYNPPPPPEPVASESTAPADPNAPAVDDPGAPKADDPGAPKAEAPKADAPGAPKADDPGAPKAEAPKADAPK